MALVAGALAQTAVQETAADSGYITSLMSTVGQLSEMDWRGMVRSFVETVMGYLSADTNRVGEVTSRQSFGGDMAVHLIETSPSLRHYAETVQDYIRSFNHIFNL